MLRIQKGEENEGIVIEMFANTLLSIVIYIHSRFATIILRHKHGERKNVAIVILDFANGFQEVEVAIDRTVHIFIVKKLERNVEGKPGSKNINCESCKYTWGRENCVVKHVVESMDIYFCLI